MNAVVLILLLAVAPVEYFDDAARTRSPAAWKGAPTLLVPMYARCPSTCALIASGLKRGVQASKADPSKYRVVLFSFDDTDTPEDLRAFRDRNRLPLSWTMASGDSAAIHALMDSVNFQFTSAGGEFAHPNQVIVLSPDGEIATRLLGVAFTGEQIDRALAIARGRRDWIGEYGPWALAVLLFLCTLSAVYLGTLLGPLAREAR
jgi:protein SCO1/2